MSFWAQLKRRKVFRVAGAYVIVAWLLVQVADIFFPALNLPEWSVTLVAGLVILGFPIALLLAWAYEITPEGVVRASDAGPAESPPPLAGQKVNYLILGLLLLVATLLVIDRFVLGDRDADGRIAAATYPADERVFAGVVPLPDHAPLASGIAKIGFDGPLIALSPDGEWLTYVGRTESGSQLYLRRNRSFEPPVAIPGTEGAIHAFFSPGGEFIGFLTDDKLMHVSLDGKEVHTIAPTQAPVRAVWLEDDSIFLADEQGNDLSRVAVSTGEVQPLMSDWSMKFSDVLPTAKYALAAETRASIDGDQAEIQLVDLEDKTFKPLGVFGFDPLWLPTGHLIFARNGILHVVRFDSELLEVTGKPRSALGGLALHLFFYQAQVSISGSGDLAFVPGSDQGVGRIVSMDGQNQRQVVSPEREKFGVLDLSADDRQLAVHIGDVNDYVRMIDLERQQARKIPGSDGFGWPMFSRSGDITFFSVDQSSGTTVKTATVNGSGPERSVELPGLRAYPSDWAPGGDALVTTHPTKAALGILELDGNSELEWIEVQRGDWGAVYSPNGKWLAYSSSQTGRFEIWIRPADGAGTKLQLSVNGGIEPVWCPCGEVFYRRGVEIWAVQVDLEATPVFGSETLAFTMEDFLDTPGRSYDVSSDGGTLYYVQLAKPAINDRIHILTNWLESLEDLADATE